MSADERRSHERDLLDRLERVRILLSHAVAVREALAEGGSARRALSRFTDENLEAGFVARPPGITAALASIEEQLAARAAAGPRWLRVVELLGLSRLESDLLLAALAPAVRRGFREAMLCLGNEVAPGVHPAAHLIELVADSVEAYEDARRALSDDGRLIRAGALRCVGADGSAPMWRAVVAAPAVREFLLGASPTLSALSTADGLATLIESTTAEVLAVAAKTRQVLVVTGDEGCGRTRAAARYARELGCAALLAGEGAPLREAALEARLRDAVLVIDASVRALGAQEIASVTAPKAPIVIVAGRHEPTVAAWVRAGATKLSLERPTFEVQRRAWTLAMNGSDGGGVSADDAELLARSTSLSVGAIEQAASQALRGHDGQDRDRLLLGALRISRGMTSDRLGRIAQRVSTTLTWDDLVLPPEVRAEVEAVCGAARQVDTVYERWGFDRIVPYGRAVSALFTGEPGTGKTMVATLIARELGVEIYRVDLSQLVDKYIGETEKHLAELFAEAERSQCVLLFDEADSLFGKRTKSGESATERYANLEVNYLLQRIESFTGIAILTTNQESIMDEAFKRRIRYRVEFPFPDEEERERLWQRVVPPRAPVAADVDLGALARRFAMTGGHIKNAMLRAAFAAATAESAITQQLLGDACRAELANLGKLVHG